MNGINITAIGNLQVYVEKTLDELFLKGALTVEQEDAALEKLDEMIAILIGTAAAARSDATPESDQP